MKNYLFDFDGTLVDSMPSFVSVILQILDDNKIPYTDETVKELIPLGLMGMAKYFIKLGVNKSEEEIIKSLGKGMIEEYTYNIPAKDGVIETLTKLKNDGYSLSILTASPHITLDVCLKRLGIYDLFTNVWSCDDFNTTKSDPSLYKSVSEKLGVQTGEVLFFDDNINALKTAKVAGMKVCGVYDESAKTSIDEIKALTHNYVYNLRELL